MLQVLSEAPSPSGLSRNSSKGYIGCVRLPKGAMLVRTYLHQEMGDECHETGKCVPAWCNVSTSATDPQARPHADHRVTRQHRMPHGMNCTLVEVCPCLFGPASYSYDCQRILCRSAHHSPTKRGLWGRGPCWVSTARQGRGDV